MKYEGPFEEPFRLRTAEAIQAILQGITVANGYRHDLAGEHVALGRNLFGDNDTLPLVSILEMPIAEDQVPAPPESSVSSGPWEILIQGFVKDDKANPTKPAYRLAADVVKALVKEKRRVADARRATGQAGALFGMVTPGGTAAITDLRIGSPVCRPPDEVSNKAYFWLSIVLDVTEDLEDPYA